MALTHEAIFAKSKVVIQRALRLRDEEQDEEFQFWAAVALELLAKAALAKKHPSLIADTREGKDESLFVACGVVNSTQYKTIVATTLFGRAKRLVDRFDEGARVFCLSLADDRNAELHSSLMPFASKKSEHWQSKFWGCVKILLESQALTLVDYVGDVEAPHAEKIIADAGAALVAAVRGRIERCMNKFMEQHAPMEVEEARKFAKAAVELHTSGSTSEDVATCPACGCDGLLSGQLSDEEIIDHEEPYRYYEDFDERFEYPPTMARHWVREIYSAEEFRCVGCGLRLFGVDELEAAELPDHFTSEVQKEIEEDEYQDE